MRIFLLTLILVIVTAFSASAQPVVYVGSNNNNTVSVIDVPTNQIVDTFIIFEGSVSDVAVSPDQSMVFFGGFSDFINVVDTSNNDIIATVDVGLVNGFDITPDGTRLFIVSSNTDTLKVLRLSDFTITDTIPLGNAPDGVSITPDGATAYISDQSEAAVYVVDTATVTVTDIIPVPGGSLVRAICVEPGGDFVYAISTGSDIASVIDTATNTVIATIGVGDAPRGIAFSPNGETAYVPTLTDVYVIRTSDHTVTTAVTTPGDALSGIDVTPDGQFVYATAIFSDSVHVIRASDNTLIDNIVSVNLDGLVNDGRFIANVPPPVRSVPSISEWGLIGFAAVAGIAGLWFLKRRSEEARAS